MVRRRPVAVPLMLTTVRGEWCTRCATSALQLVDLQAGAATGPLMDAMVVCQRCDLDDRGGEVIIRT